MLLGLSIEGKVISGRVNQDNTICEELLGAPLFEDTIRDQGITLKYQHYSNIILSEDVTNYEKPIKTRCYIMLLFGNFLFPETTGNTINILYLPLLRNINKIGTYSWGSYVFPPLYSFLCKLLDHFILAFFCSKHGVARECGHLPPSTRTYSHPPSQ